MTTELLMQLESKVAHALEVIELLRMQVEELEEENAKLKDDHNKWQNDLSSLIKRFDKIDLAPNQKPRFSVKPAHIENECLATE